MCDNTRFQRPPRQVNDEIAAFIKGHQEEFGHLCLGVGMVTPSILLRMALRSLLMLAPLPMPHKITATRREAEAWCRRQLIRGGVSLSEP